jgi:hypothetical protein
VLDEIEVASPSRPWQRSLTAAFGTVRANKASGHRRRRLIVIFTSRQTIARKETRMSTIFRFAGFTAVLAVFAAGLLAPTAAKAGGRGRQVVGASYIISSWTLIR